MPLIFIKSDTKVTSTTHGLIILDLKKDCKEWLRRSCIKGPTTLMLFFLMDCLNVDLGFSHVHVKVFGIFIKWEICF